MSSVAKHGFRTSSVPRFAVPALQELLRTEERYVADMQQFTEVFPRRKAHSRCYLELSMRCAGLLPEGWRSLRADRRQQHYPVQYAESRRAGDLILVNHRSAAVTRSAHTPQRLQPHVAHARTRSTNPPAAQHCSAAQPSPSPARAKPAPAPGLSADRARRLV